jgi:hypothetical protein
VGRRFVLVLLVLVVVLSGCAGEEGAVLDPARSDFGCDRVSARYQSMTDCWIVEGCGRAAQYTCGAAELGFGGWSCSQLDQRDMPGQTTGVVD